MDPIAYITQTCIDKNPDIQCTMGMSMNLDEAHPGYWAIKPVVNPRPVRFTREIGKEDIIIALAEDGRVAETTLHDLDIIWPWIEKTEDVRLLPSESIEKIAALLGYKKEG